MNRAEITELSNQMGWQPKPLSREGWVVMPCPLARWRHAGGRDNNPSFAIKIDDPEARCVCLSCDFHGSLDGLLSELIRCLDPGTQERKNAVAVLQGLPVEKMKAPLMATQIDENTLDDPFFPDHWLQSFPLVRNVPKALQYCLSRGISASLCDDMDLRFDPNSDRVCFPIRDWSGQLRGLQGRTLIEAQPKYLFYKYKGESCGRNVLLGEHLIQPEKPVILVEGAFDYAALRKYTTNVLVLWGCRVTPKRETRLKRLMKIYTAFDNDKAGDDARLRLTQLQLPVANLKIPEGFKDVGDLDDAHLQQIANYVDSFGTLG